MKRVYITLAVVFVALVGVIVRQVAQPSEPVYKGKPLSFWLIAAEGQTRMVAGTPVTRLSTRHDEQRQDADLALRQVGTNAIPTLLRMLSARDSTLKLKLLGLAEKQHFIKIKYTLAVVRNSAAWEAFLVLGTNAQSAVPALIEIAHQNISDQSQVFAFDALNNVGPPAKEAIPSLLRWVTNADAGVHTYAVVALSTVHAEPDRVVPQLITDLRGPSGFVRYHALKALENYGPDAKAALPALVEYLGASHEAQATNALRAIDPEAAAKAGAK